ncbi:MAG: PQQ-binding-like beta-propeller repeat protein [Gemmataceae bacterium]|nr:PQQ-binding-like beta-propeller repeat protein [Gemmataceae bacterium]
MARWLPALALLGFVSSGSHAQHWPQFRGPNMAAALSSQQLPTEWDAKKNVAWATPIPGRGWSSPVVWGDRIFVSAVLNDKTPEPRRGLYIQDLIGKTPPGEHVWKLYCLDFRTGKILWDSAVAKGDPKSTIHLKNTYASETQVTDGQCIYTYFGNLGLYCHDMDGKPRWSIEATPYKTNMGWGTGASPVLHKDRLYLVNDNEEKSFLAAYDAATGKEVWKTSRDERSNWSTPFVWENELRTEIITCGVKGVRSYDLCGKLLWELSGMSSIVIPTPSAHGGLLYVSSGYVLATSKPVYAIRPGAQGDISLKDKATSNEFVVWSKPQAGAYHPSPVVYGDYLYVLLDKGFLSCYDAKSGKDVYVRERIDPGSDKFTASPWAADGKIYCLSEDGDTYVIKAGPKFEVLAKNSLDEMCLASPALVRGSILLRTATKLYRIAE